jgi:hypothetical protein
MKIRIQGNSIRLRLNKTEVELFGAGGTIKESVNFGKAILTYQLQSSEEMNITASFKNDCITIGVPGIIGEQWSKSEEVGFSVEVQHDDIESLSILIEKDFQCLIPRKEDESDLYKNPLMKE